MFNTNKICNELERRFNVTFRDFQVDSKLANFSWDIRQGGIILSPTLVFWSSPKLIDNTYTHIYSMEDNTDEMIIEIITQKMVALHPRKWKNVVEEYCRGI